MSNVLLATDLDKTLLNNDAAVPQRCVEAIRAYTQRGGLFTVATGRPTRAVHIYSDLIELINAPIITYNGACIYDTKAKRVIWQQLLPQDIQPLIADALKAFPSVGALVFRGDDDFTCVVQPNTYTTEVAWIREHYHAPERPLAEIPFPWNKVVLCGPPAEMKRCAAYIRANLPSAVTTILSEGIFLELTGPDVGKGKALRRVAEMVGIDRSQIVAIGDSMNDIDMLQWAGTGVAVANAEAEILKIAQVTVASNEEHGVCECIEKVILPML